MTSFAKLATKKARVECIKHKITTDDRWMLKGLLVIYDNQTEDEKRVDAVKENNGIGFTGIDGEIMPSFAKRCIQRGLREALKTQKQINVADYLTDKMEPIVRRKMCKYARQLALIANQNVPIVKTPKAAK
jgi:hypothetical protein